MPREFLVDFTELQEYEVVPAGIYILKVAPTGEEVVQYGQSEKRTPYIRLRFEVVAPEEHAGTSIWQNLMLAGKGTRLTAELLRALGIDVAKGGTGRLPLYEMKGQLVAAKVAQGEYNGNPNNEIKAFIPADKVVAA